MRVLLKFPDFRQITRLSALLIHDGPGLGEGIAADLEEAREQRRPLGRAAFHTSRLETTLRAPRFRFMGAGAPLVTSLSAPQPSRRHFPGSPPLAVQVSVAFLPHELKAAGGDRLNLAPLARKTCRRQPSHGTSWPRLAAVAFARRQIRQHIKSWPCRSPIPMLSITTGTSSDRWRLRDRLCSRLNEGDHLVSDLSPLLRT